MAAREAYLRFVLQSYSPEERKRWERHKGRQAEAVEKAREEEVRRRVRMKGQRVRGQRSELRGQS